MVLLSCGVLGQPSFFKELIDRGSKANRLMLGQSEILEIEYECVNEVVEAMLQPFVGRNLM